MNKKSDPHDLSDIPPARIAAWDQHGVDAIEADLIKTGGVRLVGGPAEIPHQAWRWVHALRAAEAAPKLSDAVGVKVPLAWFGSFNLKTAWRTIAAKLNRSRS